MQNTKKIIAKLIRGCILFPLALSFFCSAGWQACRIAVRTEVPAAAGAPSVGYDSRPALSTPSYGVDTIRTPQPETAIKTTGNRFARVRVNNGRFS